LDRLLSAPLADLWSSKPGTVGLLAMYLSDEFLFSPRTHEIFAGGKVLDFLSHSQHHPSSAAMSAKACKTRLSCAVVSLASAQA
jgi:hypothetical protein